MHVGKTIHFTTRETNYFLGSINLYSGEAYYHLLFSKILYGGTDKEIIGLITNYFSATVHYHAKKTHQNEYNNAFLKLSYDKQLVNPKVISLNTTITIDNKGSILYSVYSIHFTDIDCFPSVSFTIRKFTG